MIWNPNFQILLFHYTNLSKKTVTPIQFQIKLAIFQFLGTTMGSCKGVQESVTSLHKIKFKNL